MKFSVLMSIYYRENPVWLADCFSSFLQQEILPAEIVLVKDGPLRPELERVIADWYKKLPLKIHALTKNSGLGKALQEGLQHCSHELVARMDTDDILLPGRFQKQLQYFQTHPDCVLLGGQIKEFNYSRDDQFRYRLVPLNETEIHKYAKLRNPFNHVTVMFKKSFILKAGGYLPISGFEDYYLWVRILLRNYPIANLDDLLVLVRTGNNMVGRRIGIQYFKAEYAFFRKLLKLKFISRREFLQVVLLRLPFRLLPEKFLILVYKLLRD